RIATLEGIQPTALKDLNEALYQVLAGGDKIRKSSLGGVKTAAEIINLLGTSLEASVIDSIREQDPDLAQKIMDKMFTFEDLAKLESSAIQTLLTKMDKKDLAMALMGANEQVKETFFKNMSGRTAKLLRDDMEVMGPVRLKDVDEAQGRMVSTAKDLAAKGEILIMKSKVDDQMVA
ncbi:MAG: FliG C-terminal domain-containing protein, partial [Devosia sp.]